MSRKEDLIKLRSMVRTAADAMYQKLEKKYDEGYAGWDDPDFKDNLLAGFRDHYIKYTDSPEDPENIIDMMNFLAMIRRQIISTREKLPDCVELDPDPSKVDFVFSPGDVVKTKDGKIKSIGELTLEDMEVEDDTKEIPPIVNMEEINKKVEELATPTEKAKEALEDAGVKTEDIKTGIKFTKGTYEPKERSFDVSPLMPDGARGVTFFPFEGYAYIDKEKGIHHIRFTEIDFGIFMYQIMSIDGYGGAYWKYSGSREKLFVFIEDKIIKHFKIK